MKEEDLYPIVKKYLDTRFGCTSVQDKVVFNLLKNWKIDVVGAVWRDSVADIIAVEVKRDIRPDTFLQAISQAEMYQKVSKLVYVAFPEAEILDFRRNFPDDWVRMVNLSKAKGIGVLSVGARTCSLIEEAVEFPQSPDAYKDIINQIEEHTTKTFSGFAHEDFDYFLGREETRRNLVRRKITLFLSDLKAKLLTKCADFPNIDPKKLKVEIGNLYPNGCWCYVSQETKDILSQHAHFTIGIDGKGLRLCVNMESDRAVSQFLRKAKSDQKTLLQILQKLDGYSLEIFERTPPPESPKVPHYMWDWIPVYEVYTRYVDNDALTLAIKKIESLQYCVVRLWCANYDREQEIIYSDQLTERIAQLLKDSQSFYGWVRQ